MIRALPLLFALLLASSTLRAELFTADTATTADQLVQRWEGALARLATADWVRAPFLEKRHFAIRKAPTLLKGDLVLSQADGLSLHYADAHLTGWDYVIIDSSGLLLRDLRGKELTPPGDPRGASGQGILLDVLRLDLARLAADFDLFAEGPADAWRIGLLPRAKTAGRAVGRVILEGRGQTITRLVLDRPGVQSVEIKIGAPELGRAATAEELQRRFRGPAAE